MIVLSHCTSEGRRRPIADACISNATSTSIYLEFIVSQSTFQEVKVDGFVALQGGRRQLLVQTLLHFKVKLHSYILAPLAPCYFRQVFSSNNLYICANQACSECKKCHKFFLRARTKNVVFFVQIRFVKVFTWISLSCGFVKTDAWI